MGLAAWMVHFALHQLTVARCPTTNPHSCQLLASVLVVQVLPQAGFRHQEACRRILALEAELLLELLCDHLLDLVRRNPLLQKLRFDLLAALLDQLWYLVQTDAGEICSGL